MAPLPFDVIIGAASVVAGALGALLGIGGGAVIVPLLTIAFGVDIRLAIGASIVSVIATSTGSAASHVREGLANVRVGMFLEIATTTGAVTGAIVAAFMPTRALFVLFGALLAYSAIAMVRGRHERASASPPPDRLADRLRLAGTLPDPEAGTDLAYPVTRTKLGLGLMYVAGMMSAVLGIGSGVLKVPAMDLAMRMPLKASTSTSNLMIGVTAATAAGVYFARGDVDPMIAAPVALGALAGAVLGARALGRLDTRWVRWLFVVVLTLVSVQMLVTGIR